MALRLHSVVRDLARARGFSALVVLTLALGIGATTAMFTVVDTVLLRRLPYPGIERFAEIQASQPGPIQSSGVPGTAMPALRKELGDIAAIEGFRMGSATITGGREPEIVGSPSITPNLLSLAGATPHLGRLFTDGDLSSISRNVIISHRLWTTNFGAAADIIGRAIDVDDEPHTVIGVMSPRVRYPEANAAIWRPLNLDTVGQSRQRVQLVTVRFPGVSADQFAARLRGIEATLKEARILLDAQTLQTVALLQERFARQDSRGLWLMFGAVTLVLLVACVNVSNLLLARASRQHGELALRSALGASRRRLLASALAEALFLATVGGVVGVGVALALLSVLLQILPPQLTYLTATAPQIDLRILLFALFVCLVTCFLAGLAPAIRASKTDPLDAIKQQAQAVIGTRDDWWQSVLMAGQLSLVLVLLAGAGVLLRSFVTLSNVDPGFDPDGLAMVNVEMTTRNYNTGGAALVFVEDLERRLEASGMEVTIAAGAPMFGVGVYGNIQPEADGGLDRDFTGQIMPRMEVGPDYFETVRIPIVAGRSFSLADGPDVLVINDKLASYYWGEASPIGRRFRLDAKEPWLTVVGVVGDVKQVSLTDPMSHGMEVYSPHRRNRGGGFYSILARSNRNPDVTIASVRQSIWSMDPRIPIDAMPMTTRIGESLYRQRFFVRLSSAFTVIAALLAIIGVYGTTAYWVARRRRELAIRIAVGASPRTIVAAVIARGIRLAAVGSAVGLALAFAGARLVQSLLFQTDARDPATLATVTALLFAAAIFACAIPALRAARVDPLTTLRAE